MPLRLAIWNIWQFNVPWNYDVPHGIAADYANAAPRPKLPMLWKARRDALTTQLTAADADFILLQECAETAQAPSNQARQLADVLDYEYVWRPAYRQPSLAVGQATLALSNWQISDVATLALPHNQAANGVPRNLLLTTLTHGNFSLCVGNVHLSAHAAAESIAPLLAAEADILVGDFNATPDSPAIAALRGAGWRDAWAILHPHDAGHTYSTPNLAMRYDYVFLNPNLHLTPTAAHLLGNAPDRQGFYPSDHLGLLIELDL